MNKCQINHNKLWHIHNHKILNCVVVILISKIMETNINNKKIGVGISNNQDKFCNISLQVFDIFIVEKIISL